MNDQLKIIPFKHATSAHYKLLLDADPSKKLVDNYLKRSFNFEAKIGQRLVGVIILIETRPETIEIVNLAVDPSDQKQGIGHRLIQFATHWAIDQAYKVIEIGTGSTGFGQLYLYQKSGFRPYAVDQDFFVRNYSEPIIENNLVLKDMIRLRKFL
ncbi:putative N-acetyltransferase YvbK [Lentilactobacillus fungorum]|jgi:GNAT superfamily N-acetyltransferase|uniref:N-acetyltransferase YvbK n=1 Tax=Lentilactobacillus fungorum TaxID=2201250 RepID=A0ABQ3VY56_9LACO|nr:GNAT family N-acetyltransferase [Lentilactobacillus fungorum]GHP13833.1 putative N-acetyltransferase YvbK [Lentilactobacillus fungorum]